MNQRISWESRVEPAVPPPAARARGAPPRRRSPTHRPPTDFDLGDGERAGTRLQSCGKSELARGNDALKTATRRGCEDTRRVLYRLSLRQTVAARQRPPEDSGSLPRTARTQEPPSLRLLRPPRGQTDESTLRSARRGCPRPVAGRSLRRPIRSDGSVPAALRSLDADCAPASCLRWSATPALGTRAAPHG